MYYLICFYLLSTHSCKWISEQPSTLACQNDSVFDAIANACTCEGPFFGTLCELECKNGGTIQPDTATCQCADGFYGTQCEKCECIYNQIEINRNNIIVNTIVISLSLQCRT